MNLIFFLVFLLTCCIFSSVGKCIFFSNIHVVCNTNVKQFLSKEQIKDCCNKSSCFSTNSVENFWAFLAIFITTINHWPIIFHIEQNEVCLLTDHSIHPSIILLTQDKQSSITFRFNSKLICLFSLVFRVRVKSDLPELKTRG